MASDPTHAAYAAEDRGPELIKTIWPLMSFSIIVVSCRLYIKAKETRRVYWDDALMILAMGSGIVHAAMTTKAVEAGLGRHLSILTDQQRSDAIRFGTLQLLWAILSPMFARMSFSVTLLYLTGTDPRVPKWPIRTMIVLQFVVNVVVIIVFYTQCGTRLDITWSKSLVALASFPTVCEDPRIQTDLGYFQGAFNTFTDVFLTALPAILIKHTRLSFGTKIGLSGLLCLSVLAFVASIIKTYEARALENIIDYTWELYVYLIAIAVELNIVIIVASIPLLRPMFIRNISRGLDVTELHTLDKSTSRSVFSKRGGRTTVSRLDSDGHSRENIVGRQGSQQEAEVEQPGLIQVIREVSLSYQPTDTPHVHAALVGLYQGEVAIRG